MAAALEKLPKINDPRVLVGYNTADDAGVIKLSDDLALVQTVDFFTPIVDDPYTYGQIAAANALSDVYAMGGTPLVALNILAFPKNIFPLEVMAEILRGGNDKAVEANTVIIGGHTVTDDELKYGLAVTGTIHPQRILTNAGARPGDALFLTKPLGTGTISTALKAGKATLEMIQKISRIMAHLNKSAAEICVRLGAHACTDVTGFGLLGHGLEMAQASNVGFIFEFGKIPLFEEAIFTIEQGFVPGGTRANRLYVAPNVSFADHLSETEQLLLCDPQTSGGLLIAVEEGKAAEMSKELKKAGLEYEMIGSVTRDFQKQIRVR